MVEEDLNSPSVFVGRSAKPFFDLPADLSWCGRELAVRGSDADPIDDSPDSRNRLQYLLGPAAVLIPIDDSVESEPAVVDPDTRRQARLRHGRPRGMLQFMIAAALLKAQNRHNHPCC